MKVQRDKKMNVAVRRQVRGGENQRFSPENWAYAQFLPLRMPPAGGGRRGNGCGEGCPAGDCGSADRASV